MQNAKLGAVAIQGSSTADLIAKFYILHFAF